MLVNMDLKTIFYTNMLDQMHPPTAWSPWQIKLLGGSHPPRVSEIGVTIGFGDV